MQIAKLEKCGTLVRIERTLDTVCFSPERGWVLLTYDFHLPRHRQMNLKWVPSTTRFAWVKTFFEEGE